MLEAIIRRLKRLNNERRGVSNVLVVMLSLILITVIVANVVLWNYQMNQLDIERMHESVSITNASRLTRSRWFTAQNQFSIVRGSRINGSYTDTRAIDGLYETFKEAPQTAQDYSYPSSFNLLDGSHVSGSLLDLRSNNGVYMTFGSHNPNDEDYVDQQSNVDGLDDIGTNSNFTAMQYGPDGVYNTLIEAAIYGDYIVEELWVNGYTAQENGWTKVGSSPYLNAVDYPANYIRTTTRNVNDGMYTFADSSNTGNTIANVEICVYAWGAGDDQIRIDVWNGAAYQTVTIITPITTWSWYNTTVTSLLDSWTKINNAGVRVRSIRVGFVMSEVRVDAALLRVVSQVTNYSLELEAQWVTANHTRTNKELCIKTGFFSNGETLSVQWWNTTSNTWQTIIDALNENSWNNISISNHLTSSIFTIRFKDVEITDDTMQSGWQIDCVLLHTWDDSYVQVEFIGNSSVQNWAELVWKIDCSSTISSVNVTLQLYDYEAGEYSTSGDGYITASIGTTDISMNQTITANSTRFRDAEGNWKMKMTARGATSFNLKIDLIELKVTSSNIYRLEISNLFTIDLSTYPLSYVYGIEIMVRYNVSEAAERWFIKAYDWDYGGFIDAGFNVTYGNQPVPNEWNDYTISITENWTRYIRDGAIQIMFCDEGASENQTFIFIDFIGVRVILNGILLDIKNSGATTVHIVSIWVINVTHHMRYDADFFINSGESETYIRVDIPPPAGNFTVKIVTERGNIDTF